MLTLSPLCSLFSSIRALYCLHTNISPRETKRPCCKSMHLVGEWRAQQRRTFDRYPLHPPSPLATMPKLSLSPIFFSAAHISKWDTLPEDTPIRVTESRRMRTSVDNPPNDAAHDMCVPETRVLPAPHDREVTSIDPVTRTKFHKSPGKNISHYSIVLL